MPDNVLGFLIGTGAATLFCWSIERVSRYIAEKQTERIFGKPTDTD